MAILVNEINKKEIITYGNEENNYVYVEDVEKNIITDDEFNKLYLFAHDDLLQVVLGEKVNRDMFNKFFNFEFYSDNQDKEKNLIQMLKNDKINHPTVTRIVYTKLDEWSDNLRKNSLNTKKLENLELVDNIDESAKEVIDWIKFFRQNYSNFDVLCMNNIYDKAKKLFPELSKVNSNAWKNVFSKLESCGDMESVKEVLSKSKNEIKGLNYLNINYNYMMEIINDLYLITRKNIIESYKDEIDIQKSNLSSLSLTKDDHNKEVDILKNTIDEQASIISERDQEINGLQTTVTDQQKKIDSLNEIIKELRFAFDEKEKEMNDTNKKTSKWGAKR